MRNTTSIHLHAPLDLPRIATALIRAAGSESLIDELDELLAAANAYPARLYLIDRRAGVFYAIAGFGCAREAPDLPLPDDLHPLPDHLHELRTDGVDVGMIEVLTADEYDQPHLGQMCAVLAPVLVALERLERAHSELQQLRMEVQHLTGAGELLRQLDLDVLLTKVLEAAMGAVRAEVGALVAMDGEGKRRVVSWGLREDHIDSIRFADGGNLVAAVMAGKNRSLRLDQDAIATELDLGGFTGRLTGLLALPVVVGDRTHGALLLANPTGVFTNAERRLAEAVCGMAAIAIDNAIMVRATVDRERMQRELDLARGVQESMWPVPRLSVGRLRVAGASRPCNETGGDYYTYQERGGRLLAAIGDVSGHGLGAALFTTTAHAILQQQLRAGAGVADGMRTLNDSLVHAHSGRFMTAALVDIDRDELSLRYASAGHNPMLLVRGREIRWLGSCTIPLGIETAFACPLPAEIRMERGDLLLLYTDGVTEAFDPQDQSFGTERLAELAIRLVAGGAAPDQVVAAVFAAVETWAAGVPWHDDLTLVAIVAD